MKEHSADEADTALPEARGAVLEGWGSAPENSEDEGRSRSTSSPADLALGAVVDIAALGMVLVLSFAAYLFGYLPLAADIAERKATEHLAQQWDGAGEIDTTSGQTAEVFDPYAFSENYGTGDTFAKMRIPALGQDWEFTLAVGTSLDDLRTSPGWYETTQLPGQPGNFATAAHRDGSNAPYMHIDSLKVCDDIIVETIGGLWVYTVMPTDPHDPDQISQFAECAPNAAKGLAKSGHYTETSGQYIVAPTAIETIFPIPGGPLDSEFLVPDDAYPLMTLTSCHPRWQNYERIIVHAALETSHARS